MYLENMSHKQVLEYAKSKRKEFIGLSQIMRILDDEVSSRNGIPPELINKKPNIESSFHRMNRELIEYYEHQIKKHEERKDA